MCPAEGLLLDELLGAHEGTGVSPVMKLFPTPPPPPSSSLPVLQEKPAVTLSHLLLGGDLSDASGRWRIRNN